MQNLFSHVFSFWYFFLALLRNDRNYYLLLSSTLNNLFYEVNNVLFLRKKRYRCPFTSIYFLCLVCVLHMRPLESDPFEFETFNKLADRQPEGRKNSENAKSIKEQTLITLSGACRARCSCEQNIDQSKRVLIAVDTDKFRSLCDCQVRHSQQRRSILDNINYEKIVKRKYELCFWRKKLLQLKVQITELLKIRYAFFAHTWNAMSFDVFISCKHLVIPWQPFPLCASARTTVSSDKWSLAVIISKQLADFYCWCHHAKRTLRRQWDAFEDNTERVRLVTDDLTFFLTFERATPIT